MKTNRALKEDPASKKEPVASKKELVESPAANFETPASVLESTVLSTAQKGAALKNWAEDAERLSVAANEGMTGGERSLLPEVKAVEAVLEAEIKAVETPVPAAGQPKSKKAR